MPCLLEHLLHDTGIQVDVATAQPGFRDDDFVENGVRYFVFGQPRFQPIFEYRQRDLDRCRDLVREQKPDLVHIHGSERFFGLLAARGLINVPALISIQGLVEACLPAFFGALSPAEALRSHRLIELATGRGVFWRYREYSRGAVFGREILANAKVFMGRTAWDRAQLAAVNPSATYYHGDEVLRPQFSNAAWDLSTVDRHTVIFTNAGSEPRRGVEVLLRAMQIVRRQVPSAELRIAGTLGDRRGYDRFLQRMIIDTGLAGSIQQLGYLSAEKMAAQLERAHVFALPSFIENSSNSLCEAMQVGVPSVASYVGGIPSLVDHNQTGLMFPPGDPAVLASSILRIFRDGDLAVRLSRAARAEASQRHAPAHVVSQVMQAYREITATQEGVPHGQAASCSESR
jgi:glycosyltransferase involved in cell wall biosynthesis